MNDEISLQDYADEKFPERARLRLLEKATYPLPYVTDKCVICQNPDTGLVKCQNCENKVCEECVRRIFLDEATKEGAFLLMHRRYCMHFGLFPNVLASPLPEPAFLRNLRNTGSSRAYKELQLKPDVDSSDEESEVEVDVGPSESEKERRRLEELTRIDPSVQGMCSCVCVCSVLLLLL